MKIANDHNLFTVAHLAVQWQVPFHLMQKALDLIQAEPALALNGKPYYSCGDERTELLREYFETRRANTERSKDAAWTASLPIPENYRPVSIPKAVPAGSSGDGGSAGVDAK